MGSKKYKVSRRAFLKTTGAAGIAAVVPLLRPISARTWPGNQRSGLRPEPPAVLENGFPMATEPLRSLAAKKGLLIGTAFSSDAFKKDPVYGEVMAREFNCLVAENEMKLDVLQRVRGQFDFGPAEVMMAFAGRHGMKVRAVPLVWHDALPEWARDKTFPRSEALDILREHIFTVMRHFRGRVFAWDVLNEGLSDTGPGLREEGPWYRSIGPEYVERAYHWAHEADPQAVLFYNDYNMDGMSEKADRCYKWIKQLLGRGVPIHGVGLQYHVRMDKHPQPSEVTQNIRRFNDLGLIVHITELDVWLPKNAARAEFQQQADIYRGVFEAALAAPKCQAVVLWGFTDRYSWVPGISNGTYDHALIFDRDYRPKPAYEAISSVLGNTAPADCGARVREGVPL
jgi:endo-1,4-beta-xylanase